MIGIFWSFQRHVLSKSSRVHAGVRSAMELDCPQRCTQKREQSSRKHVRAEDGRNLSKLFAVFLSESANKALESTCVQRMGDRALESTCVQRLAAIARKNEGKRSIAQSSRSHVLLCAIHMLCAHHIGYVPISTQQCDEGNCAPSH